MIGADNLDKQSGSDLLIHFQIPSVIVGSIVLIIFVKNQQSKVLLHLLITVAISSVVAFVIVSVLRGVIYISPTWFIDLLIAVLTILAAMFIGGYFRSTNKNAT